MMTVSPALRIAPALAAALIALMACGGGPTAAGTPTTMPSATATPGGAAPRTAILDHETFVAVRTLPAAALSAEQLEAAGTATGDDGSPISMARADTAEAAPWELVSAAPDGWRVWRPKIVLDVLDAAGAGASIAEVRRVDWPDTCLGAARPGEACAQVVTPGYLVVIEQQGRRIEYHTGLVSGVRLVPDG